MLARKKLIAEVNSPINGKIRVYRFWGRLILEVGGLEQSGPLITSIWTKGLKNVQKLKSLKVQSVLILGLGAGSAARLVNRFWPSAKITGVEIDPEIIKSGSRYFRLNEIKNLEIIIADASQWIKKNYPLDARRYDLVLVDLYFGDQAPAACETQAFLKRIKTFLASGGIAIFNRLYYREKKKQTDEFVEKLNQIFPHLDYIYTPSNLLLFCHSLFEKIRI